MKLHPFNFQKVHKKKILLPVYEIISFQLPKIQSISAELSSNVKNLVSHRWDAFNKLKKGFIQNCFWSAF
jgi:hypothetical protein